MNRKIFILLFLFVALISVSAVSAADLDDGNETVALSDIGVEKPSVSNDVNAMDDLNNDDAGSEAVLENAVNSSAAGEIEILGVGDSDSDVLGAKGSKIMIDEAYYQKIGSDYKIIVTGYVRDVDDEDINTGTVSIYLNDELKGYCDAEFGMFSGEVDVGPGSYNVRVRYHDDSGDYDDSQNNYYDNPIIIKPPEPTTWYVNGSKPYGGGGKSEADAFSTLNEALYAASNNDTVKFASGTYAGNANTGVYIQKILTFEKYGDGEAIFDGQGQGTIWSVGVDTINIYGLTFINGGGDKGGALYFIRDLSNSVINATFRDNSVTMYGGAIYVDNSVSNLTLRSTFINNTANEDGAAVYIKNAASNLILNSTFIGNTAGNNGAGVYIGGNADNVKVYGEYIKNTASQGGAIYANKAFSSSVIDATFINNTAKVLGGAFCFNGDLTGVDISGKFLNNTGGDSIIYVANSVSGNSIHDSVFLNNEAYKIFSVKNGEITAKDNWFGSDASNYYKIPEDVGIDLESWLFLNATADPSELEADESSAIIFKLSSFDGSEIIDYDASKMNIVLDLSQTLGVLDKTSASIGENITYTAKDSGNATVTGKFETASYTVSLTNNDSKIPTSINITNSTVDLKVNEEIASGATLTPADAGNLTYTSSNSSVAVVENGRIKALAAGNATITVSFAGNDNYSAAKSKTIVVSVTLNDASVSVNNATLDLFIDDEFVLVVTTNPEGLNVTFTPGNSGVVSVDENGVVTALKEGNSTVRVSVGGDGVYALNTTDVAVTVKKIPTEIIVGDDVDMKVGESAVVNATLSPADAGELDYTSSDVSVVSVNGIGELTAVADGTAVITVSFAGDDKYAAAENKTVEVTVAEYMVVSAPDLIKYYGGSERFIVTLKDKDNKAIANENVTITINGRTYIRTTNSNGEASMAINLDSGEYDVLSQYKDYTVSSKVTVKSTISAKDVTKIFCNGTQYYATFLDTKGNLLKNTAVGFNINGVFYTRYTNENGVARLNINLNPGTYLITATNPNSTEQHSNNITVLPSIVENHDLTKYYKNGTQYWVKILNDDGTAVGAGVSVSFNINGVFYTRTTNELGYVRLNINLDPNTYIITVMYNNLMVSNTIKVLPVLSANNLNMYYRDGSKFEAKLVDGQGNVLVNQLITFNINGVFYDRMTNDNGIAMLNINLMPGKYIITSMYSNGASISNNVTIKLRLN